MQVILLEKVESLGDLGDQVRVRPGYARNYLIPQGKARYATPDNVAEFERRRAEYEQRMREALEAAQERRDRLEGLAVTVTARAGGEGKLFGSIGPGDIARVISDAGVAVERREVRLPNGPIRQTGEHEVEVRLHPEVTASVNVNVVRA